MLPPGGEGKIKVTLRPKGGHPEITKHLQVLSNDPEQPRFRLTVKATLLIDMVAQPPSIPMLNLAPGESDAATFSLQRSEGSTATVTSVRIEDTRSFSIRQIETEPGALATYEVRFAGRDVGTSATRVVVETTGEHTPRLVIPVRATAVYNLIYPRRVALADRGDGPIERTIRITTRRGDHPPRIGKIRDPDGLLEIEVLEPEGPSVGIRLRVRPDRVEGIENGAPHQLFVRTNDRDEPNLEIAYQIRTPPAARRAHVTKP